MKLTGQESMDHIYRNSGNNREISRLLPEIFRLSISLGNKQRSENSFFRCTKYLGYYILQISIYETIALKSSSIITRAKRTKHNLFPYACQRSVKLPRFLRLTFLKNDKINIQSW